MAKKQLKKLNQPKKYLQGGSNMASVAQTRQNPYYLDQVDANAAKDKFQSSQDQLMQTKLAAAQAKKDSEAQAKAEMDQTIQQSVGTLGKAAVADKKAGTLGKLFTKREPTGAGATTMTEVAPNVVNLANAASTSATWAPLAGTAAPTAATFGQQVATTAVNPVFTNAGGSSATQMVVGQAAPTMSTVGGAPITGGANIASTGTGVAGQTTAGLSNLANAGIGIAANIGGTIIRNRTNDDDAYTFSKKEKVGNTAGTMLSSAGTGFGIGNMLLPGVGGLIGAGIGAGVGAIKARKENKASQEEADRLQKDLAAQRGAFQSAFVNSRLTGADTGFGLNSSTNMNNQFTNSYQVARTGGVTGIQEDRRTKRVPGGKIVPIEGTDAVEFVGRSHEKGGVTIDKNTEVEGGETMDQVAMNNNNKQDYIFSKYLKLGGKSFAQRHKEILKGNGSQADIQQLAAMQEKVAGRNPQQVAAYGGFHKYLDGGAKPCPECPPGTICDVATGACVPDEDNSSNSYDWQSTGVEGFKAKQNAAAPSPSATVKQEPPKQEPFKSTASKADMEAAYQDYMMGKKADELKESQKAAADQIALDTKIREEKEFLSTVTDIAALDAAYDANKITGVNYKAKRKELESAAPPAAPKAPVNPGVQPPANSTAPVTTTTNTQPVATTTNPPASTTTTTGTATYNPAPGVTPPAATTTNNTAVTTANPPAATTNTGTTTQTNTGATNPPPAAVTNTNPPAATNTGTSTEPTVTYVNSNDPNAAPPAPQTPEEIEAARLAGLPRLFMGASRKVDEATGNVTIDKGKPLMGVGAMEGSRLGTTNNSEESLGKVTNNAYDQAWNNKADNLYTNQVDASGGGLSFSNYVTDRDKIAGSNWGKKYGYTVGMSEAEAKAAHGKFEADVHSLFKNNPDEMMGYFQYIIDGGDPNTQEGAKNKKPGTYLGKDAEQIRTNLKSKGYIDANGKIIPGKEKAMQTYLEEQATDNFVGPIHNALGSYTAERGSDKIKLEKEKEKKKTEITTEIPKKFEPCPPGTYRSGDGTCKPVGDVPQGNRITGSMLAGLGQLVPVGAALMNPYKIAPGIVGAPAVKGALMPRVNLNQERASNIQQNVAYKNAVINQNAGPGALAAMQMANTKTNQQMLNIAQQEQDQNRQLAGEEAKLGMQASMFNAETDQKRQMFNTEFNQKERQYRREDILGALDAGAGRIAGIVKDDRAYKSDERLARALDETGSYDRFTILEQLNKEAKRKNSPYANTTEAERRRMAAAMHKELNPEGYVGKSEYTKLQEEKDKLQKEKDEAEKKNQAKFGGARQYVSRLGQLSGVRATKAKI